MDVHLCWADDIRSRGASHAASTYGTLYDVYRFCGTRTVRGLYIVCFSMHVHVAHWASGVAYSTTLFHDFIIALQVSKVSYMQLSSATSIDIWYSHTVWFLYRLLFDARARCSALGLADSTTLFHDFIIALQVSKASYMQLRSALSISWSLYMHAVAVLTLNMTFRYGAFVRFSNMCFNQFRMVPCVCRRVLCFLCSYVSYIFARSLQLKYRLNT